MRHSKTRPDQSDTTTAALNALIVRPADDYASEAELVQAGFGAVATLRDWAARGKGPPRTLLRRKPFYRIGALREWLLAREQTFSR